MSLDLDAIKARAEAATRGPWEAKAYRVFTGPDERLLAACWRPWGLLESIMDDTEFIAHARTDVPALVAEIERLRAENESLARGLALAVKP